MKIGNRVEIFWTYWNSWQFGVFYGHRMTTYAVGPFDIDIMHKEKS